MPPAWFDPGMWSKLWYTRTLHTAACDIQDWQCGKGAWSGKGRSMVQILEAGCILLDLFRYKLKREEIQMKYRMTEVDWGWLRKNTIQKERPDYKRKTKYKNQNNYHTIAKVFYFIPCIPFYKPFIQILLITHSNPLGFWLQAFQACQHLLRGV
jgi:hypothetical protein